MKKKTSSNKLWQQSDKLDRLIEDYTVGNDHTLDQKLVQYDCMASIAHTRMLGKMGVFTSSEISELIDQFNAIIRLSRQGKFTIRKTEEDCHTAIENHLTEKLGESGKKVHTFRSRNDQVITALRLMYRDELQRCDCLIESLLLALQKLIRKYGDVQIPGFSHTRKAMPTTIRLWANALVESMLENKKLLDATFHLIDQSPLGTGAGYGIPHPLDREYTADQMGFQRIQKNPIFVQNSRGKFESHILHTLSFIMFDLSKLASDLIFFTLPEFQFFKIPRQFLTGSSIMPHKQNPDALELLRGYYHRIVSFEMQVKNITANLISGYHRDFQLTKEPTIQGMDITRKSLEIATLILENLKVNKIKCRQALSDELYSVERIYRLVHQGIPFRDAYYVISSEYRG